MKYDKYKAFPYPVLRPESDDYKDAEFQVNVNFGLAKDEVTVSVTYALSSDEIKAEIDKGTADYVCLISCRDTYCQRTISTSTPKSQARFDSGALRGEVKVNSYVVAKNDILAFTSPDINTEFGP